MSYLIVPVAFIFILCSAVVLHEFGHFIVAKLFGIRVETFSVGFGPRLFGFKRGHTDYRVSAIPLGGYVKLGGDDSNAPLEGQSAPDIPREEMFNLRPRWQKISVALAGPVVNILTALAIPFTAAMIYGVPVPPSPVIKTVVANSAAAKAGLQPGDKIVSFNGANNPSWDRLTGDALLSPNIAIPVVVERNGQHINTTVTPASHREGNEVIGELGIVPDSGGFPAAVVAIIKGSPAAEAGLTKGDRVLAVGGEPVHESAQVTEFIKAHPNQAISLTIERNGVRSDITTPTWRLEGGLIGVTIGEEVPLQEAGIKTAAYHAVQSNVQILRLTGKALGQVFSGQRSVRNTLSGPIGIYDATERSVGLGWAGVFSLMGFLSLNLGIFNLLPIPVLDGGAIFLLLVEGLLAMVGMSISTMVRDRIQQVGFVVVLLLMVFVLANDVVKKVTGGPAPEPPPAAAPSK